MAKKELFTFPRQIASTLYRMASQASGGSGSVENWPSQAGNAVGKWVMKAKTAISACDYKCVGYSESPVPGSGIAVLCYRDTETGKLEVHKPGGQEVEITVYSLLDELIPVDWFFLGTRDLAGTIWAESVFKKCDETGSGGGSGLGSGSGCIDVVTDVSFDPYTCKLIVCTRNICFPPGTIIGPEDCGSGSGNN